MKRIISTFLIALAAVALTGTNVSFAKEESVKSIEIVKYPSKCAYNVGEGYSTEGMVVKATLSNKKKVEVSNSEITSFSGVKLTEGRPFENEGWKGVTLTYKNVNTFYGITVFDPAKEYFIQFDSDGGTQIESIKIDASTKEFKLPVPKKKSAAFLGWYHSNGNKYTTFTSGMGPALSFKAKWGNSIKFNANGGSGKKIKNGIISSDYKLPKSTFKKSGYKFIGWGRKKTVINQNEFFDVGDSSSFINTDKNITLYAQWVKPASYKISYDSLGKVKLDPKSIKKYTSGKTTMLPDAETKGEDVFMGWRITRNGKKSSSYYYEIPPYMTGNLKLTPEIGKFEG